MKTLPLYGIRFYQRFLSLDHGWLSKLFPGRRICRFEPSCSSYAYQAIDRFGVVEGGLLAIRRIGRCHPWGGEGWDPVPERI